MRTNAFLLCLFHFAIACGGGGAAGSQTQSGVIATKTLGQLTDEESSQLCDWSLKTEGGAGTVQKCPDGTERQTHTKARCLEDVRALGKLACNVTVGQVEDCSLEEGKDACAAEGPACGKIKACADRE